MRSIVKTRGLRFSVCSLFPEQVAACHDYGVIGKALEAGRFELCCYDIRKHAVNRYGQVDDSIYGGGSGMLMMPEPLFHSVEEAKAAYRTEHGQPSAERIIYLSPRGPRFDHQRALALRDSSHLLLIAGRYEGIDQRVLDELQVEELSIGDYVLSGGELACSVLIDSVARLLPGVLPQEEAWQEDSYAHGLLEGPQYTRPACWKGQEVPEVYRSGHAAKIKEARRQAALLETFQRKPELLAEAGLSPDDWELLFSSPFFLDKTSEKA